MTAETARQMQSANKSDRRTFAYGKPTQHRILSCCLWTVRTSPW